MNSKHRTLTICLLLFLSNVSCVKYEELYPKSLNENSLSPEHHVNFRHLLQEVKYPIICSFSMPSNESDAFKKMGSMDIIDTKDGLAYVMIHDAFEHSHYKVTIPSLQIEEKKSKALHDKPKPYISSYFKKMSVPNYPTIQQYACYRNVEGSYQTMDYLALEYPTLVEVIDIGPSHLKSIGKGGYEMKVLKLSNIESNVTKSPLFVICSIHARELAPSEACARFAEDMLESYGTDADKTWILDYTEIHIILQGNPDARNDEETFLHFRRKNMNFNSDITCWSDTNRGVDMNRNFPHSKWGTTNEGSECSQTYAGESAGSEKETKAIVNYIESVLPPGSNKIDPETGAYVSDSKGVLIDIHSYWQAIFWPYAYSADAIAPNDVGLTALAKKMASFTSPRYDSDNEVYITSGDTTDWAYEAIGVAAYTIEIGYTFHEPCDSFENTVLNNALNCLLYAARIANAPYRLPKGPEVTSFILSMSSEILSVDIEVSDKMGSNSYITENQNIVAIHVYIDSHPYDDDAIVVATISPESSSTTIAEQFEVPISGLSFGSHKIFIQAYDMEGPGPVYSNSFDILSSNSPSFFASRLPSFAPSLRPSEMLTSAPSETPSVKPSGAPSHSPSVKPSGAPSHSPSVKPTNVASESHSAEPNASQSDIPSDKPTDSPSNISSVEPSGAPDTPAPTASNCRKAFSQFFKHVLAL